MLMTILFNAIIIFLLIIIVLILAFICFKLFFTSDTTKKNIEDLDFFKEDRW